MDKNIFAVRPPMGWNSYDYYDTTVTEEEVKANAIFLAEHMKAFGWEYVVVDIQWYAKDAGTRRTEHQYIPFGQHEMDAYGRFQPAINRFPSAKDGKGFKPLAEYIQSLGLKFGIHIMRGIPRKAAHDHCQIANTAFTAADAADPSSICGWNPDMYGVRNNEAGQAYYDALIAMYADWGVDFIKCDDICDSWMYREAVGLKFSGREETKMLHQAIMKTGRNIVLSLSPGPAHIDRAWQYCKYANMWRITDDFWDKWELVKEMFARCEMWQDHVKKGCFPDCDMLPVGKVGKGFGEERDTLLTRDEQKTMMTLWCIFRSPLMVGTELTKLDDWTLKLLTNKELLELLDEDYKGEQIERCEEYAIWKSINSRTNEKVIAMFNLSDQEAELSVTLTDVFELKNTSDITLSELWEKTEMSISSEQLSAKVAAHGVKVYKLNNI